VVLLKVKHEQAEVLTKFKFFRGSIPKKGERQIVMRGDAHRRGQQILFQKIEINEQG